jgi:hypothetical protein
MFHFGGINVNIPQHEHLAVVYEDSIFILGDERSRTNPGHGYPDSYESRSVYLPFKDQSELEAWISRAGSRQYVVLKSVPLKVEKTVSYDFSSR